jgi:glycerol uptake facilitator-like aquaporin
MNFSLRARAIVEFLGTAFLLAAVVGSGIMGERLAAGNVAIALLANTLATGAILVVLILTLGSVSGAHFNPAVTLAMALTRSLPWHEAPAYLAAQFSGAFAGVAAAHLMFGLPLFFASIHARHGAAQLWSEAIASLGLLFVIWGCTRFRPSGTAYAVGAYITAAYWFTASTSFANPAVTLARSASNTFAGIRPVDVPCIRDGTTVRGFRGDDLFQMAWDGANSCPATHHCSGTIELSQTPGKQAALQSFFSTLQVDNSRARDAMFKAVFSGGSTCHISGMRRRMCCPVRSSTRSQILLWNETLAGGPRCTSAIRPGNGKRR